MKQPATLSREEAERKVHLILEQGAVIISGHCRRDSMRKRQVTTLDIYNVLEHGMIIEEPAWSDKHGNWKFTVKGADIEGIALCAVTAIFDADLTLIVITVY